MQLSREQSRAVDRHAIEVLGIHPLVLMENAARAARELFTQVVGWEGTGLVVCGKGNNGGDGLVFARQMAILERHCPVLLCSPPDELSADARANYDILAAGGHELHQWSGDHKQFADLAARANWIVDAMLGTGAQGNPRPPFNTLIDLINKSGKNVLALDVPSGMDCETGEVGQPTIRANHTMTFVAMKQGFVAEKARPYLGRVMVADIGFPLEWLPGNMLESI